MSTLDQIRQREAAATNKKLADAIFGDVLRIGWCTYYFGADSKWHNARTGHAEPVEMLELERVASSGDWAWLESSTDRARLLAALDAVLALHQPVKKWEPYEGAGYTFATEAAALEALGDVDVNSVVLEDIATNGLPFFEVCAECGRIESEQLSEMGEEWGYRESLWPCPTVAAITDALGDTQ